MTRKKIIFKTIFALFSLIVFLTVSTVGETTRVYAVATGAAIAGAAALGAGVVFLGYLAFTGGSIELPTNNRDSYITRIGESFAQTTSGSKVYNDIKNFLLKSGGIAMLPQYVFKATGETLTDIYNDVKSTSWIRNIMGWDKPISSANPTNGFNYDYTFSYPYNLVNGYPMSDYEAAGYTYGEFTGPQVIWRAYDGITYTVKTNADTVWRYFRNGYQNGVYYAEVSNDNSTWMRPNTSIYGGAYLDKNNVRWYLSCTYLYSGHYCWQNDTTSQNNQRYIITQGTSEPIWLDKPIYVYETDITQPLTPSDTVEHIIPQWYDIVDENAEIVPYVQLPSNDPNNYNPEDNNKPWAFPLGSLLDSLEDLGENLFDMGVLGELLNRYAADNSVDYNYYTNNDETYNYYYSDTYYQNQYIYNYNYNIKEQSENMPVDLNNLHEVTENKYIDTLKQASQKFSDTLGNYVKFWHNADYTVVYVFFGGILWILLCAFIGKWGGH